MNEKGCKWLKRPFYSRAIWAAVQEDIWNAPQYSKFSLFKPPNRRFRAYMMSLEACNLRTGIEV